MKVIVMGSKFATKDATSGNDIFYCLTTDGKNFWANEPLRAGTIVDITEKKAGDKYADKDGVEQIVKKDGFNLNVVMGSIADARAAIEAKAALAELDVI